VAMVAGVKPPIRHELGQGQLSTAHPANPR
jgi:hypothetical protein